MFFNRPTHFFNRPTQSDILVLSTTQGANVGNPPAKAPWPGTGADVPLWQLQFTGRDHRMLTRQLLTALKTYLEQQPDSTVKTPQDMEDNWGIRVLNGGPPMTGERDPDNVGILPWQAAIYCAGETPQKALELIVDILRHRNLSAMPPLFLWCQQKLNFEPPTPWVTCEPALIQPPTPFAAPPPRGRRHIICQLERQRNSSETEETEEIKYMITTFGGIYTFRSRFDQQMIQGERVTAAEGDKANYVRYLEDLKPNCQQSRRRVESLLVDVLMKVPVYLINAVGSRDPMATWVLSLDTVCHCESIADE